MTDIVPIRRALISVFDTTGLPKLAQALALRGVEIISMGNSAAALRAKGIAVTEVSDHTAVPENLAKQLEMLLPSIQGGVLGPRDCPEDRPQIATSGIAPIDLVVVNLCPFEAAVAVAGGPDACVAAIAVDGPALIRAAAKNHAHVAVLTEPAQYFALQEQVETSGGTTLALRKRLAATAYAFTAAYDTDISRWLAQAQGVTFPHRLNVSGVMRQTLRYGENPHQQAALYVSGDRPGVASARRIQGKELSYNNVADADAALECVAEFDGPTIVIVKHANPRGVATAATLAQAWDAALASDPASTIEGIVAANRTLDATVAERIVATLTEVIIAPDADDAARAILAGKKDCRLLLTGRLPDPSAPGLLVRSVAGGFLAQTRDAGHVQAADLRVVTKRSPTAAELNDLLFASRVCKHVRSNAIVYARATATVGIGAGQMSRVDSARVATWKGEAAGRALRGSVAASDAFFPFADGLDTIIAAGATAVIQPGGSNRDAEVIAAADAAGITMVFTGMRQLRH